MPPKKGAWSSIAWSYYYDVTMFGMTKRGDRRHAGQAGQRDQANQRTLQQIHAQHLDARGAAAAQHGDLIALPLDDQPRDQDLVLSLTFSQSRAALA